MTELRILNLTDSDFDAFYTSRIEPILNKHEAERKTAVSTFYSRMGVGIAGSAIVAVIGYLIFAVDGMMIGGTVALVGAWWWAYGPVQTVANKVKSDSLITIAEQIGCEYRMLGFSPEGLSSFKELSLLPECDRSDYQDRFSGSYRGCSFSFCDGHLEKKVRSGKNTRWVTVFRGQLLCIAFPKKFLGTTVVRRDAGWFNFMQRWATKLQRVGLSDSRLEKAFEVYSDDQVEARYLIHPVFMERMLELETQFKGQKLRCAFIGGDLLIAIEGGDKFEMGSMFKTLLNPQPVRIIVNDLSNLMRVIDAVLTAEQGALPA